MQAMAHPAHSHGQHHSRADLAAAALEDIILGIAKDLIIILGTIDIAEVDNRQLGAANPR
jgi:hypothetical protein